ncbi:MAG: EthD domain-containing protein [Acidimicrobiales bacterium]
MGTDAMSEPAVVHLYLDDAPVESAGVVRLDIAVSQEPFVDLRGSAPDRPHFAGLSWTADAMSGALGDRGWHAERHIVWDDGPGDTDPTGWIKQVSLVRRRPDIDVDTFAARYRGHGEVARAHHGMFRYAQTLLAEPVHGVADDDQRVDGISELWFVDRAAWRETFYVGPDSAAAVRADTETFIDFATTRSAIVMEWPAMGSRP